MAADLLKFKMAADLLTLGDAIKAYKANEVIKERLLRMTSLKSVRIGKM